ncbi:MAG TPA: metallophosphoesterase [Planctomycetota bacterium]|jgi:serine/threonine protein phosphatase 1|nr:metallophosphoesterase [Planctomycetota bacterium]
MATWIIGDIHGCSGELAQLLEQIPLDPGDNLLSVGDLFHRGPDPAGVMDLLQEAHVRFILGNHEMRLLDRFGLAPQRTDGADRPEVREEFDALEEADMAGDGRRPCHVAEDRRADVLRFLQTHSGFYMEQEDLPGAGPTPDGRPWCVVHAGLFPGRHPSEHDREEITSLRRLAGRGKPFWYESYVGPNLVIFGHTPSSVPRIRREQGQLVVLGVDTGCVYGGQLTAYCPERDEFLHVPAKTRYANP